MSAERIKSSRTQEIKHTSHLDSFAEEYFEKWRFSSSIVGWRWRQTQTNQLCLCAENAETKTIPRTSRKYVLYYIQTPSIVLPQVVFFHSCRFERFPRSRPVTFDWDLRSCPAQFVLWYVHLLFLCECNLLWYWLKKPLCSIPQSYWGFFYFFLLLFASSCL